MEKYQLHPNTSIWLDAIRALAAHAVLIGHSYMIFFSGVINLPENVSHKAVRLIVTSFGSIPHQAVIAFFVMSGYLVGGRALHDMRCGKFKFGRYFCDRLIRLWLVLLPALLLTAILDWFSLNYGVGNHILSSDIFPRFPSWWLETDPWSWSTLLSNSVFLQMIASYQFGTNTALWSISNEFWYYMLFPCLIGMIYFLGKKRILAIAGTLSIIAMFFISAKLHDPNRPNIFLIYFFIWSVGACAVLIKDAWRVIIGCAGIVYAVIWFWCCGFPVSFWGDSAVAALVLGFIMLSHKVSAQVISRSARFFAGYSYSLYAIHFPILICLISFDPVLYNKIAFSFHNYAHFIAYLIVVNFIAICFWYIIERNTRKVKIYFSELVNYIRK